MTGVNPFNFASWNLGGLNWNAFGEPNEVGLDDAPSVTTTPPPPPPPPAQATDTVTIGSNFTFNLGSYQPPPGWNIDEYLNTPLPIESEAIFVEIDLQDPSFWLSSSEMFPEGRHRELTEEQATAIDFETYNNSLAKALGVPWPKYQMEVESARFEFQNSNVQSHHQGGSYFFSLEPSARVTSQNANPIIERYENRQAANNLNQQLNDLRKSSKEDFLKLVQQLEANGYRVQGHKIGSAYDRNPNDSITEVYQRVYYTLNGRVLPGLNSADGSYPLGGMDRFQLVGRAGGSGPAGVGIAAELAKSMRGPNAGDLTSNEIKLVREAFGSTIDLSDVKIVLGDGGNPNAKLAFSLGNPAITQGNTVYFDPKATDNGSPYYSGDFSSSTEGLRRLLHEFTHVRQFQQLGFAEFARRYATDLINNGLDRNKVYDYQLRNTTYATETLEGQAQMVGDYAKRRAEGLAADSPEMQSLVRRLKGSGIYGL